MWWYEYLKLLYNIDIMVMYYVNKLLKNEYWDVFNDEMKDEMKDDYHKELLLELLKNHQEDNKRIETLLMDNNNLLIQISSQLDRLTICCLCILALLITIICYTLYIFLIKKCKSFLFNFLDIITPYD